jgi:hypothetical protein
MDGNSPVGAVIITNNSIQMSAKVDIGSGNIEAIIYRDN